MYPFIALVKLGATLKLPKSAIAESNVFPVAPSIVVLKLGTTGKPRLLISICSSASSVQYTVTGDNGKQFFSQYFVLFFQRPVHFDNKLHGQCIENNLGCSVLRKGSDVWVCTFPTLKHASSTIVYAIKV